MRDATIANRSPKCNASSVLAAYQNAGGAGGETEHVAHPEPSLRRPPRPRPPTPEQLLKSFSVFAVLDLAGVGAVRRVLLGQTMTPMQVWEANADANEGPRSHTHLGGQRVSPSPPNGKPSSVRRRCGRADAPGYGGWKHRRGSLGGDSRVDQTPIGSPQKAVSFRLAPRDPLPLGSAFRPNPSRPSAPSDLSAGAENSGRLLGWGGNRKMRLQDEAERCRAASLWSLQEGQQGHLRPNMPRCPAREEAVPFVGRHVPDAFEIKLDARGQRRFRLFKCRTVCCDIEVGADCVPLVAADSGVASQREIHSGTPIKAPGTFRQRITAIGPWLVEPS